MKSTIHYAILALMLALGNTLTMGLAIAQTPFGLKTGWIEGVLITEHSAPAASFCMGDTANAAYVVLQDSKGNKHEEKNDLSLGGYYSFRNLEPGIYEVFVKETEQCSGDDKMTYRPQHIFGVIVDPAKRTRLDITVHKGSELEEIGRPLVVTEDAVIVSEHLHRLGARLSELQNTVEMLQDRLEEVAP